MGVFAECSPLLGSYYVSTTILLNPASSTPFMCNSSCKWPQWPFPCVREREAGGGILLSFYHPTATLPQLLPACLPDYRLGFHHVPSPPHPPSSFCFPNSTAAPSNYRLDHRWERFLRSASVTNDHFYFGPFFSARPSCDGLTNRQTM